MDILFFGFFIKINLNCCFSMYVLYSVMLLKLWFVKDIWMLKIYFVFEELIYIYIYKMLVDFGVECCMLSV